MNRWRIGVDVGGTKIAAGLVSTTGLLDERLVLPTPATEGASAILGTVQRAVETLRASLPPGDVVTGVGIGTGGVVDHARGVIVSATGLLHGWAGTRVADELHARLGLPVAIDNDGNALALGEHRFGAGRGHQDVLYVAVGTGIGGALVLGGELRRGAHHSAGELGHQPAPGAEGRPCSCGGRGHIEAAASGPSITAAYRERSGDTQVTDLRVVAARAAAGDGQAAGAIEEAATILGKVVAGLANTVDPEAVVIGGGVAQLGPILWPPLETGFRAGTLPPLADVPVLPALLGPTAAIVGAATLVADTGSAAETGSDANTAAQRETAHRTSSKEHS
ncbi:ROK family protein [Streptomyces montanisoli]|uniref:ROK family protein n=1 Tax=Streptomyces montanisoli TaxID=2798581 RepID=A0A940MAA4_9ACTN|nr:ROK family protein [Streptomyces montanisoli]MBP0457639.1 ROK family protein [Streptomyces montanisoli]